MPGNPSVVFVEPKHIEIQDRPVPAPKPGEVLIHTRRSLISLGTELTVCSGEFPAGSAWAAWAKYPFYPGYSNAGVVEDVGAGVDKSWIGKRVATGCHHCAYDTREAARLNIIPGGVSDEEAVFSSLGTTVANGVRRGGVTWGDSVVVFGAGILGQLCVRFCRIAGAQPVVVVDAWPSRLALLPKDPAVIPVLAPKQDPVAALQAANHGRLADIAFEVTGVPALIPAEFAVLRKQGRFVILSSPRGPTTLDLHDVCNAPSFTIIGTHGGSHPPEDDLDNPWSRARNCELLFDLIKARELDVASMITHRVPAAQAPGMYRAMLKDKSGALGVVFEWDA